MKMTKCLAVIILTLLFSVFAFSQTKSITDAQNEIKTFANPQKFSVAYDSSKYVTNAELKFETVEKKTPIAKLFKEFSFQISSLFAIDGIDAKPVRTRLCINTRSKKFHFSSNRNLILLLDNESIPLGEADRSTEVRGRKIKETLCWEIDKEFIKDLGNSSAIGYEVGGIKNILNSTQIQSFRNYAKLVEVAENSPSK